jgi:hypothetical protein
MRGILRSFFVVIVCLGVFVFPAVVRAQGGASISGTVADPTGGVVVNATVAIHNPVSGYERSTSTDGSGNFSFPNLPLNPYHLSVAAAGFAPFSQDVDVRSAVPISLNISLKVASAASTVTVEGGEDLLENDPTAHTDVDRNLFDKLPLESASSSLSSLITQATPGIAADSNGFFHGFGDHGSNSFSVDGQPITDQQSKVYSNQIPLDSVQSLEVIQGAPPAEYGGKTSLVINVTTRSGQGVTTPHGTVTASYGAFGTSNAGFDFEYGGQKWGNFIAVGGLNSGRFLDPPEFSVAHDKGNQENLFDRVDYQFSSADSIHFNLGYTRSWFQTPNSFDAQNSTLWNGVVVSNGGLDPNGNVVGPTDQRSKIGTFNVAPSWTRLINSNTVFTLGAFVRRDAFDYFPSDNPFADLGPPSLQRETFGQNRTLTNAGARASLSYVKGIHNLKAGAVYEQTFLNENDSFGIVDPTFNAPCLNASGVPFTGPGLNDPSQCTGALQPNIASNPNAPNTAQFPLFTPLLGCFDLTRPTPSANDGCAGASAAEFLFKGHTDVKELALYVQDTISKGNWSFNLGIRGDVYHGITKANQAEPRLGVAYNIKRTNTVLRVSYARTLETPFNENLVVSSIGCNFAVIAALVPCVPAAVTPGFRNEFHAGLQQAFGKYFVIDGEYLWKYTHNSFDIGDLGNTPIFTPIEWHNSKIPGYAVRASVPNFRGLTALVVFSSIAARFFTPQVGGLGTVPAVSGSGSVPFRIDHDEKFNLNAHIQYQPWKRGPWAGFNWRYDSGLVAGASPCFGLAANNTCPGSFIDPITNAQTVSLIAANAGGVPFSADQEFQAGFFCGSFHATPTQAIPGGTCPASQFGSTLIKVPAPGTEDDDHNPPRIQSRNLFDLAVGDDNLLHGDKYKWSARVSVINLTNKVALYNFLSTFSGTHYVTPRAVTAQIGFHF